MDTARTIARRLLTAIALGLALGVAALGAPFYSPVSAQSSSDQRGLGVIGGLGSTSFTGSGAIDVTNRVTYLIGVSGDLPFGETFSFRPEIYLSGKGAMVNTSLGDYRASPNKLFKLSYVQLPVLLQLRTAAGSAVRPYLFGGLAAGVLLSCQLEEDSCDDIAQIKHRTFDVGVVVGGGLEWRDFGLGARYEAGVRAMEASTRGNEIYNGALALTVRYVRRARP